jgi:hypothetical protein
VLGVAFLSVFKFILFYFLFVFTALGFELWASHLLGTPSLPLEATPPALFCDGFFGDKVLRTICSGLALN